MAVIETWIKTDIKSIVKVTPIHGILFTQDNMANLIGVELLEGGQPATVTGSVSANVLRADGTTVAVAGTLSGNKASVTLPQAAYAVPGMLAVVIKLTDSSTVTTIGAIQAIVYRASTDTIIDPGTIIPSVQDLIAAIDAAVESIPPDYSALTAEVGDLKSALSHYMALSYNQAIMIADNTNYDSLTTDGTYKCTTSAHAGTMTNAPASNAHTLYVINSASSGWVIQIAFINSVSGFLVKARIKNNNGVWYPSNSGTNKWITLQTDVNVTDQLAAFLDTTLAISGKAADAKATGDAISALSTASLQNRGKISSLGYTSIAQCNKMGFYEFVTADVANLTDLPTGWTTGGYVITLKKASGAMQFVFNNRNRYMRDGFTGTWYPDVTVDTTLTKTGFAADAKAVGDKFSGIGKCYAIYDEGSWEKSNKRLKIYMPQPNGYLMIEMRHYNYNRSDGVADCWGINEAYAADGSKTNRFQITNGGEWECAVRMTNGKDFSGGGTHGDEKNATTLIFKDGVPCAFSDFSTAQEFAKLKIIQTTDLYSPTEGFVTDPEGSPTASYKIAEHGTEWEFSKDGICVTQYIKWTGAHNLANSFMAMFPGRKKTTLESGGTNIFDSIFTDVDYAVYTPTSDTSKVWAKAKKTDIYSDVSKVHVVIDPVIYPDTLPGGNKVSETDNGASNNYYKLYWPVTSIADYTSIAYTTTDGELWKAQVYFRFEIN